MPEEMKRCPLCGNSTSRLFDQRKFRNQFVINRICQGCGLVYQSPHMTDIELQGFYEAEYRQMYQGEEGPTVKDLGVQRERAQVLDTFTRQYVKNIDRHLDIGCSSGYLLQHFQSVFNSQPVGIEPGTTYRAYAREKGLVVYDSLDELDKAGEGCFGLISMAHVLEHISDPVGYLINLRTKYLREDGCLLLEVPNLYGHECFEVAHMVSFSSHTLEQVIIKAGFNQVGVKIHGQPRSQLIPLYITMVVRPLSSDSKIFQVHPEKYVRLKRRLGMIRRRVLTRLWPDKAWLPFPKQID